MKARDAKKGDVLKWALEDVEVVGVEQEGDTVSLLLKSEGEANWFEYQADEECSPGHKRGRKAQ